MKNGDYACINSKLHIKKRPLLHDYSDGLFLRHKHISGSACCIKVRILVILIFSFFVTV